MKIFFWLMVGLSTGALAQTRPAIPEKHIPPSVMLELRLLENQMDLALSRDCAPERCVSKGCIYREHLVVDLPRASSLPGLPAEEGLGAVPPQEYLTQASCDFAHEKSVSAKDAQALVKRLEQRLSKGWLRVTVGHQLLEPISPALAESPPQAPPPAPPEPVKPAPAPEAPKEWDAQIAARELWVSLLPHFSWMIAVLLGTLSVLVLIWAARRLGKETLEEKAMAASLLAPPPTVDEKGKAEAETVPAIPEVDADASFVDEQRRLWRTRVDEAHLGRDGDGFIELLKSWLREREFPMLAKAILVFGDRLSTALPSDGELASRKVEFAQYLKTLDEKALPQDAAFFRTLQQHTISSALLAQADAETYRSIALEFGANGVANVMTALGGRPGALFFALVPHELQAQVARVLSSSQRREVTGHLLDSNRMSREEHAFVLSAVDSARAGTPLPRAPVVGPHEIVDRGHPFDAAGALSVLLSFLPAKERASLLAERESEGVLPAWYEDICFASMLENLPSAEVRTDALLQVDVKALAGWLSLQAQAVQDGLVAELPQTFQNALKVSENFASREEQLRLADRGQAEIVTALKKLYAQGRASFHDLAGAA